jgi:hypothetical protein
MVLFIPEEVAGDHLMEQGLHSIAAGLGAAQDRLNLCLVAELNGCAGGVGHELPREVTRNAALVTKKQALQLSDVCKRAAIGEGARGVHGLGSMEVEGLAILAKASLNLALFLPYASVALTPAPKDIEAF